MGQSRSRYNFLTQLCRARDYWNGSFYINGAPLQPYLLLMHNSNPYNRRCNVLSSYLQLILDEYCGQFLDYSLVHFGLKYVTNRIARSAVYIRLMNHVSSSIYFECPQKIQFITRCLHECPPLDEEAFTSYRELLNEFSHSGPFDLNSIDSIAILWNLYVANGCQDLHALLSPLWNELRALYMKHHEVRIGIRVDRVSCGY